MLDSLVRVSRRVGQVTDRFATDPEPTPRVPRSPSARGQRALTTVPAGRTDARNRGIATGRVSLPRSTDGPTPPGSVTPKPCGIGHLSRGASDRRRTGRGVPPAESAPVDRPISAAALLADATASEPNGRRTESDGRTLRSSPFASERFHVLLNSLFKVLFNFPSRYLFAIGLASVFSLRWSLPPALGCIIKQPDSEDVAGA
jgi:hypothetical protein